MIPTWLLRYLAALASDRPVTFVSRDKNLARVRAVECGNEIQKRSFAGARRASQLDQFAQMSLKRHTIESFDGC